MILGCAMAKIGGDVQNNCVYIACITIIHVKYKFGQNSFSGLDARDGHADTDRNFLKTTETDNYFRWKI